MLTNTEIEKVASLGFKRVVSNEIIYKYVDFDIGFEKIIQERTLKFSNPKDFNDPFDCNEKLLNINLDKDWSQKYLTEAGQHFTRETRRELLKKSKKSNIYHDVLKDKKKEFKVCCFSEKSDEILMWSHYANKHSGLCIGFDLEFLGDGYVIYPVTYIDKIEPIDGLTDTTKVFYYWLTAKSARWDYEQELRMISKNMPDILPFEANVIKEVKFGCNVKETNIKKVVKAMKRMNYKNVKYSQMKINTSNFLLQESPIKY